MVRWRHDGSHAAKKRLPNKGLAPSGGRAAQFEVHLDRTDLYRRKRQKQAGVAARLKSCPDTNLRGLGSCYPILRRKDGEGWGNKLSIMGRSATTQCSYHERVSCLRKGIPEGILCNVWRRPRIAECSPKVLRQIRTWAVPTMKE